MNEKALTKLLKAIFIKMRDLENRVSNLEELNKDTRLGLGELKVNLEAMMGQLRNFEKELNEMKKPKESIFLKIINLFRKKKNESKQ